MKIKDIVKESRPRERFQNYGPKSLSEPELLAIILRTGSIGESVLDLSNKLISEFGLKNLFDLSIEELIKIKGIGKGKAIQILVISELIRRINCSINKLDKITSAKDVFNLFKENYRGVKKEIFSILLLDTQNKIIKVEEISIGILDASIIHPREIFKSAIRASSSKIILIHNHPSGESRPSQEDLEITKKMIEIGEFIGIEVLDHVIMGDGEYWSYVENDPRDN